MNTMPPGCRLMRLALVMGSGMALVACQGAKPIATTSRPAAPMAAPVTAGPATAVKPLPADSIPAIAQREVIRRQEQIRRMDDAALRASQAMAEDDLEGAVKGYRGAIDGL